MLESLQSVDGFLRAGRRDAGLGGSVRRMISVIVVREGVVVDVASSIECAPPVRMSERSGRLGACGITLELNEYFGQSGVRAVRHP